MLQEQLVTYRKKAGLTQEEVASRLNVTRQTVSKWEKGISVPDAQQLVELSSLLDVPVSVLLGMEEAVPAEKNSENAETAGSVAENLNLIAQRLALINEQLATKNRRAKRIWRVILAVILVLLIFTGGIMVCNFLPTDQSSVPSFSSEDLLVNQWAVTGEVNDLRETIVEQIVNRDMFSSAAPNAVQVNFTSLEEAARYIGYEDLSLVTLDLPVISITVTAMGDDGANFTQIRLQTYYQTGASEGKTSVVISTDEEIYFSQDELDLYLLAEIQDPGYSWTIQKQNGRRFYVATYDASSEKQGKRVLLQEKGVIYNLWTAYAPEDSAEAEALIREWMNAFN